jgi:hypothetical protein
MSRDILVNPLPCVIWCHVLFEWPWPLYPIPLLPSVFGHVIVINKLKTKSALKKLAYFKRDPKNHSKTYFLAKSNFIGGKKFN